MGSNFLLRREANFMYKMSFAGIETDYFISYIWRKNKFNFKTGNNSLRKNCFPRPDGAVVCRRLQLRLQANCIWQKYKLPVININKRFVATLVPRRPDKCVGNCNNVGFVLSWEWMLSRGDRVSTCREPSKWQTSKAARRVLLCKMSISILLGFDFFFFLLPRTV